MLDYEWIFAVFGLVMIVTQSSLLAPVRSLVGKVSKKLEELLNCPLCFAFWAGILFNYMGYPHTYSMFLDGLFASGITFAVYTILWKFGH